VIVGSVKELAAALGIAAEARFGKIDAGDDLIRPLGEMYRRVLVGAPEGMSDSTVFVRRSQAPKNVRHRRTARSFHLPRWQS
jgi:hypothetical protein